MCVCGRYGLSGPGLGGREDGGAEAWARRSSLVVLIGDFAYFFELLHDGFCAGIDGGFWDLEVKVEGVFGVGGGAVGEAVGCVVCECVGAALRVEISRLLADTLHSEVAGLLASGGLARAEQLGNVGSKGVFEARGAQRLVERRFDVADAGAGEERRVDVVAQVAGYAGLSLLRCNRNGGVGHGGDVGDGMRDYGSVENRRAGGGLGVGRRNVGIGVCVGLGRRKRKKEV